jgi:hypothetical protein
MNEATRRRAYGRRRFKSRAVRARAAKLARARKRWAKRIKTSAMVLAALMQLHGTPALETWVAERLLHNQNKATEIHRKLTRGGHGKAAVKKKKRRESP